MSVRRCAVAAFSCALLVATADSAAARTFDDNAPVANIVAVSAPQKAPVASVRSADPQQRRFWVHDKRFYRSNWYAGAHRKMVPFGCTAAPYYDPDPRCSKQHGFHHGLDVAMPCGTRLFAGIRGTVVAPGSAGSLGAAYGANAFRIRNSRLGKDFVVGHVRKVFVSPGDRVPRGTLLARASDAGAPDGCHLHFEVRPAGQAYTAAVAPKHYLHLRLAS